MAKRTILHLCADIGSDSLPYRLYPREYEVFLVGKDIGVENFHPRRPVHGIIANPVCLEFSRARSGGKARDSLAGMDMVNACLRIIEEAKPNWWVIENPAMGVLDEHLGPPDATYQPWQYGSPWTKRTSLWGTFVMPAPRFQSWDQVRQNRKLYIKPGRKKPSLVHLHKSSVFDIAEFYPFKESVLDDMDFRSLCSQRFARAFKEVNP